MLTPLPLINGALSQNQIQNYWDDGYLFTDKKGDGLDEWLQGYLNSGVQPDWEPKQVRKCDGYHERWADYNLSFDNTGLMNKR